MADWTEIEQLQADLQKAQQSIATQKLSERNCIEILMKLEKMNMIHLLHSCDGKEYLTPNHLLNEIKHEIDVHGGRVNLVELQSLLNVDFSVIENKCKQIAQQGNSMNLIYGQMVTIRYLNRIADEINDLLKATGHVTMGELSRSYDLPGDFLQKEIPSRIGNIIKAKMDSNTGTIYTEAFIARHKHRIRGILSAVMRPIQVGILCNHEDLSVALASMLINELLQEGRVKGHLTGGGTETPSFTPIIYSQSQNKWVDKFFNENGYLEYDAITRLGIHDARSYLQNRLGHARPFFLKTVCVGLGLIDQMVAHVEEVLSNNEWNDVTMMLPSSFSIADVNQLLEHVIKTLKSDAIILCDVIVTPRQFVESCLPFFDDLIKEKSEKEADKAKVLTVSEDQLRMLNQWEGQKKGDKKEERRKRAMEGSGSTRRIGDHGGSGQGAREVKTKGMDKKKMRRQKEQEQSRKATRSEADEEDGVSMLDVESILQKRLPECPKEMLQEIAVKIIRPLNEKLRVSVKSVFVQQQRSLSPSRSTAVAAQPKRSRKQLEEEVNREWTMTQLAYESFKFFNDATLTSLHKHLLLTSCTRITNSLLLILHKEFLPEVELEEPLIEQTRMSLLARLPPNIQPPMTRLNQSLSKRSCEAFDEAFKEAASPPVCDVMIKTLDKKKERQTMHGRKMSLLSQLEGEVEPSLCFHLCVVVIFQTVNGTVLDIPGKLVPAAVQKLESHLDRGVFVELLSYEQLVMKASSTLTDQERSESDTQLREGLPRIKELAATTKKKQHT